MNKEKADAILHDLSNEYKYAVNIRTHCGEYAIEVVEHLMCENHIYISPKIIEVCNIHNVKMSVFNSGRGQEYMRIIIHN